MGGRSDVPDPLPPRPARASPGRRQAAAAPARARRHRRSLGSPALLEPDRARAPRRDAADRGGPGGAHGAGRAQGRPPRSLPPGRAAGADALRRRALLARRSEARPLPAGSRRAHRAARRRGRARGGGIAGARARDRHGRPPLPRARAPLSRHAGRDPRPAVRLSAAVRRQARGRRPRLRPRRGAHPARRAGTGGRRRRREPGDGAALPRAGSRRHRRRRARLSTRAAGGEPRRSGLVPRHRASAGRLARASGARGVASAAPGGCLVLETPNPLSITVAASNFWLDPSHLRPLHPERCASAASRPASTRSRSASCTPSRPPSVSPRSTSPASPTTARELAHRDQPLA